MLFLRVTSFASKSKFKDVYFVAQRIVDDAEA